MIDEMRHSFMLLVDEVITIGSALRGGFYLKMKLKSIILPLVLGALYVFDYYYVARINDTIIIAFVFAVVARMLFSSYDRNAGVLPKVAGSALFFSLVFLVIGYFFDNPYGAGIGSIDALVPIAAGLLAYGFQSVLFWAWK